MFNLKHLYVLRGYVQSRHTDITEEIAMKAPQPQLLYTETLSKLLDSISFTEPPNLQLG